MNPVLVVDDDESYRELVMLTLEDHCDVEDIQGFPGGAALLQHLADARPEAPALVLLDLHMGDMRGIELVREIRKLNAEVPIAFLSGAAGAEEREACLAAGAFAFLRKPGPYEELIRTLQGLLQSLRARG